MPSPVNASRSSDGHMDIDNMDDGSKFLRAKDVAEEKLEKLLFGDDAAFHDALKDDQDEDIADLQMVTEDVGSPGDDDEDRSSVDLENMDDADLFFLDSGVEGHHAIDKIDESEAAKDKAMALQYAPSAWEDSDDERIAISLQSHQRLRKLRTTENEDSVTGKEYVQRLRKQYQLLHPMPRWAVGATERIQRKRKAVDDDLSDSDIEEDEALSSQPLARLLQNAGHLVAGEAKDTKTGNRRLRPEVIDIMRLKDVPGNQPSAIDSLSFHPHYPILLSSGPASTLFLHHISPDSPSPSSLLTSLHIRNTPLYTSSFSYPSGDQIIFSGRRRYFHTWDLDSGEIKKVNGTSDRKQEQKTMERFKMSPCGRWMGIVGSTRKGGGIITILDSTTLQWVSQVRIDSRGGIADFCWWGNGEGMCVVGKNGEVSEWDCQSRRTIARWMDQGAVGTTVVALGGSSGRSRLGGDRWIAIGSSSGIVNIYDRRPWQVNVTGEDSSESQSGIPSSPKPVRVLDQLTTPTSHLCFSNDGQLLIMASRWKKDALRLVHLPSCTVYRNWPTSNTPFGRISAVAISPKSDVVAVANEAGKIRLWNIQR
ncbi:RNA polymerase II subunit A C-terminal domain phosphatase [Ascosphaera pollenicola]|nr:RNA polymerase II subunit A C-terminal domain phosphatase [Ascosphaera pollenicola]